MGLPRQLGCGGGTLDPLWLPSIVHLFIGGELKKCWDLGSGVRFGIRDPSLRKKAYFKIAFSQTVDRGEGWAGGQPAGHPGTTSG